MDWLDNLPQKKILPQKRPRKSSPESIKKYKEKYYIENVDKYTERNRKASRERSIELMEDRASEEELCHMIEQLSTDDIIYKMKYILDNPNRVEEEKPKNTKSFSVTFW